MDRKKQLLAVEVADWSGRFGHDVEGRWSSWLGVGPELEGPTDERPGLAVMAIGQSGAAKSCLVADSNEAPN